MTGSSEEKLVEDICPINRLELKENPMMRDLIESFAFAIIMALVIKSFLAEAYKVPTGSMEPTIHGARENGDRILVDKLANLIRDPKRWEIWVFQYPNNRRVNYVKRIAGVGPESISLINGDVYTAPYGTTSTVLRLLFDEGKLKIQRKPQAVQDAIFSRYPRIKSQETTWSSLDDLRTNWIVPNPNLPGELEWRFEKSVIAHCRSTSLVHFRHEIRDQRDPFAEIGPTNHFGEFEVGDLRLAITCIPLQKGGFVICEIRDPQHDGKIIAKIPVEGEEASGGIYLGEHRLIDLAPNSIPVSQETKIRFTNVDNRIELVIDGKQVATIPYDHLPRLLAGAPDWPAGVGFGVQSAEVRFNEAQVYRDIYYRGDGSGMQRSIFEPTYQSWRTDIPAGHYYMLGDNSPSSNDSRDWSLKILKFKGTDSELRGDMSAVVDPDALENRLENPYTISRTREDGKTTSQRFFVDDFGNKHALGQHGQLTGIEEEPSPTVPRHLFVGRAYAVFLPLARMKIIR